MFRKEYLQYQKFIRTKNRFTNPTTVDFVNDSNFAHGKHPVCPENPA